ncbi:NAD(P)/FAD-dependent oxidoreductase [Nocardia asteroides NBRC 15531]|uniref:Flavin-containing monooxygenase n=1 Tax=Nocardia asteroides NBRC 15531 TaxID=1110697 RepID=U5E9C3_NOCAS|nr:NAD(P)/FAD-dependent oxidoreductase [Nocardia asteroides]TLF70500.1 NAD(P)/FAD-dependent oxidoreductase [Nocardia asteroides NBRC 15531]UGT50051.1 NAD(P)/FAD-dependent oxidoreductase [Nocardia asteroides]SFN22064.1 hypothetical protein SAMN05444423_107103 [Nocardia asteroides]VEG37184.1 4-hydroxyacetophenone monooxygenase [Nocardia asteroides]GAD81754.1 putative flavin-containing monooxygenase [Nocardia asteroides NBRC 15531]
MRVKSIGQEARGEGNAHIAIIGAESSPARSVPEEDASPRGLGSVAEPSAAGTSTVSQRRSVPVIASKSSDPHGARMVRVRLRFPQGGVTLDVVHTARWDDGLDTAGRRIAVIGTGSTGVQVVSALQPEAERISHFVRSPQWVMWAPLRLPQPAIVGAILRRMPRLNTALYRLLLRSSDLAVDIMTRPSWRRRLAQEYARTSLRVQVRDPRLRASLTPDDEPFCKRQVVSDTYYRAIAAPNADLVPDGIERIEPHGIRTADGRVHDADLLILATGFTAHNYMRPMRVVGRDGATIDDAWAEGPRAYRMTAIPGFPNFFTMLGPNSPIGTISVQYAAELTAHGGTIDLWPFDRDTLTRMLTEPDDQNYQLTGTPTTGSGCGSLSVSASG